MYYLPFLRYSLSFFRQLWTDHVVPAYTSLASGASFRNATAFSLEGTEELKIQRF